jgi:hypothetical protein
LAFPSPAADDPNADDGGPATVRLFAFLKKRLAVSGGDPERSKSPLLCVVNGREGTEAAWQLHYENTVVKQGKIKLDGQGQGLIRIVLPEVRVRSVLNLVVSEGELSITHPLVLLPLQTLASAKKAVKSLGLGVVDPGGKVREALAGEGAEAEALTTDLQRDGFAGGCAVLAGCEKAGELAWLCDKFEGRLKKGMTLVVVNPPGGWARWGIRCMEPNRALGGPVRFAAGFGVILEAGDLRYVPWKRVLEIEAGAVRFVNPLAWLPPDDAGADAASQRLHLPMGGDSATPWPAPPVIRGAGLNVTPAEVDSAPRADIPRATQPATGPALGDANAARAACLIATRKIGSGHVAVVVLPPLEGPSASAAGAVLLGEVVQWVLQIRGEPHN